jgi:hypothetical protein
MLAGMSYVIGVLVNTPWWVWLIFVVVTTLGLRDLRPRRLSTIGMSVLPLVSLILSLLGLARFGPPLPAVAAWALAAAIGAALGARRASRRPMTLIDGDVRLAGSWFSLGLAWAIFAVQYAQGVLNALIPGLRSDPLWIAASFGFSGLTLGLGLGWLVRMLQRVAALRGLPRQRDSVDHAAQASGGIATRSATAIVRSAPCGAPYSE